MHDRLHQLERRARPTRAVVAVGLTAAVAAVTATALGGCFGCFNGRASCSAARGAPRAFVVEPYLVAKSAGELWLLWERALTYQPPREQTVTIYRDGAPLRRLALTARDRGVYRLRVPVPCGQARRYAYRVDGMATPRPLRSPPCPSAARVRFSFITDTQQNLATVRPLVGYVSGAKPSFVLHGGDVVQVGGCPRQWRRYLAVARPFAASTATVAAAGNHEKFLDRHYEGFRSYMGVGTERPPAYHFASGPVDVLVLNSNEVYDRRFNRAQVAWLRATLARLRGQRRGKHQRRWIIAMMHHSPYSRSISNAWFVPRSSVDVLRRDYVPLFHRYGVDIVLSGHTHIYERSKRGRVHYVVGGPAGGLFAPFATDNPYSLLTHPRQRTVTHFEASRQQLELRTVDLNNRVIDRLTLRHEG